MATKEQINFVKTNANGYIGGYEIVQNATDEEISLLIDLQDEYSHLYNQSQDIKGVYSYLIKSIKSRMKER